jgi:hypothetical protein
MTSRDISRKMGRTRIADLAAGAAETRSNYSGRADRRAQEDLDTSHQGAIRRRQIGPFSLDTALLVA